MVPLYTLSVFRCPSSGIKASLVEAEDFLFRLYKLKDILSTLGTLVWETRDLSHKSVGDGVVQAQPIIRVGNARSCETSRSPWR